MQSVLAAQLQRHWCDFVWEIRKCNIFLRMSLLWIPNVTLLCEYGVEFKTASILNETNKAHGFNYLKSYSCIADFKESKESFQYLFKLP